MPVTSTKHTTKTSTSFKYSKVPKLEPCNCDPESTVHRYSKTGDKPGVSRQFSGNSGQRYGLETGTFKAASKQMSELKASQVKASNFDFKPAVATTNLGRRNTTMPTTGRASFQVTLSKERKSMIIPPSGGLSTRKSIGASTKRKSTLPEFSPISGQNSINSKYAERKSTIGISSSAAKHNSFKSTNHTRNYASFKYTASAGKVYDDYEYTTGMRYSKIPDRGGAKNPYSQANPHPKSEITRDRLKPGYREQWLQSLESRVPDRAFQRVTTPMKAELKNYGDKSTAIKTTTIKKTITTQEHTVNPRPRTSKFDIGLSDKNSAIRESKVVSNKVFE